MSERATGGFPSVLLTRSTIVVLSRLVSLCNSHAVGVSKSYVVGRRRSVSECRRFLWWSLLPESGGRRLRASVVWQMQRLRFGMPT